jgi:hypothetical protein
LGDNGISINFLDSELGLLFSAYFKDEVTWSIPYPSDDMGGLIPFTDIAFLSIGPYDIGLNYHATINSLTAIPEPSTVALALGGAALVGAIFFRRRRAA